MNEMNENITNSPSNAPRSSDITNAAPPPNGPSESEPRVLLSPTMHTIRQFVIVGGIVFCCVLLALGLAIAGVQKVREAAARTQSMNNLKQMALAVHNCASNTSTGDIPPAYGVFPHSGGRSASFFAHLLPYIECYCADDTTERELDRPVGSYIALTDPRNPGTDSTISYCTNGTLLNNAVDDLEPRDDGTVVISRPRYPTSFAGRPASLIILMERSGLDGAHKWTNANNVLGTRGQPPPFPQLDASPKYWHEGTPQGFTSAGCCVALGDATVRVIGTMQPATWQWACDPALNLSQPPDW